MLSVSTIPQIPNPNPNKENLSPNSLSPSQFDEFKSLKENKIQNSLKFQEIGPAPMAGPSLKRKRPPRIQIPDVLEEIKIDTIDSEGSCVENDVVCIGGVGFGVSFVKGKKKFMEDSHKIASCLDGDPKKGFFGVYDGHGGRKAAEFVAENLHTNIIDMVENCTESMEKEAAVKAGYLKTDQEFLNQGVGSGTCCVTAIIQGKEMVVSNLGDCRAVLSRGGVAEALTLDHKAEREDERRSIEDKGGYVEIHRGAWRVHGVLAVSRSIGDAHLKNWVSAEPDTKVLHLTPDMEFLILASDGLWDQVRNQEAVDIVLRSCFHKNKPASSRDLNPLNDEENNEYTCVKSSTSPKVKRVSLLKQQKMTSLSPCHRKAVNGNSNGENESLPMTPRRTSLFQYKNAKTQFLSQENVKTATIDSNFDSKSESPPMKLGRTQYKNAKTQFPSQENNKTVTTDNDSDIENESPPYKNTKTQFPNQENKKTTTTDNDFDSENKSPPTKLRRTSLFQYENTTITPSPSQKNKKTSTNRLALACEELVNFAVSKGSFDDVTVMVIDLSHFS